MNGFSIYNTMKLPKDWATLGILFLIAFVLIKGFDIGEFLGSFF